LVRRGLAQGGEHERVKGPEPQGQKGKGCRHSATASGRREENPDPPEVNPLPS
jgi:hypothetical protein